MQNRIRLIHQLFLSILVVLPFIAVPSHSFGFGDIPKILPDDGDIYDRFGTSVSIEGDTLAIVSANDDDNGNNSGSVYVYKRIDESWLFQAKLNAGDPTEYDSDFGSGIAVDGDTIVVGAAGDHENGLFYIGAAYVFVRNGDIWSLQAKLTADDGEEGDIFGGSVSLDGNTVAIGAEGDDDHGFNSGAVYVFVRNGESWGQQEKLSAIDSEHDGFAQSVSLYGDTVVVSALGDDEYGRGAGAAYVFIRNGDVWSQQAKLAASDAHDNLAFGKVVSLFGDTVAIGALGTEINGSAGIGSVYFFEREGDIWTQTIILAASDGEVNDLFGTSVSINNFNVVIGAYGDDHQSGSAYVFVRSGTNWIEQAKLTASDRSVVDQFGAHVSLDGDTVVIGAPNDDDHGVDSGSAYVFSLLYTETPVGELVIVQPPAVDEYGYPIEDAPSINFTFENIEEGGTTTVVVTEPGAGTTFAPSGFRISGLTGAPVLFDIETTATLAEGSSFEVCFDYSGMNVAGNPANVTLAHEVDGVWVDITTDNNTTELIICGEADSFSYFAILESLEIVGPTDPIALGTEAVLGIDVGDPALTDTVHWEWGDGLTTEVAVTTSEVVTTHIYTEPGVYTATVTLVLAGIEAGSTDFQYAVVYDPTAGFVTGGGWFNSPEGSYLADPGLVGKANFGFVSKYKKGAIIPTGTTEFQFKAGYLNFRSLEYQWLVIAGSRAQFKGIGTINGVGNFGFMLTAVDEALTPSTDVDLFRIKIWDIDNDGVVYDNGLGDADDGDAATAIDGGSIVIHKPKK